ncbi:hypothetical protein LCL95_05445 [Bacillus timonensis]|nr:hypothetical protein [Bacillus timonensis]
MRFFQFVCIFLISYLLVPIAFANTTLQTDIEKVDLKLSTEEIAITFFDLTNGEATLINDSSGGNILINTGGPNTKKELENYLNMYDVNDLKAIIITKSDIEYTGNLTWLTNRYNSSEIIIGKSTPFENISLNSKVKTLKVGEIIPLLKGLEIKVIHDNERVDHSTGMDLSLKYGTHNILYMSSASQSVEEKLLKDKYLRNVNILKVAEFGSGLGTSQLFVNHIDPQVAIIFQKKGFNPSQDVIERLHETWIDIYQTKQFGNISIKFTKDDFQIITISMESVQQEN